ncbi:MAG: hypothetical protein COA71_14550 [SAR86 cluster bacterium]|uniref:Portal protein n=1 Tax=SAR86 cluster bacterium TaxID=2030880 RepID=A0A2A5C5U7_9GAMM|nr:MAG: hypothetical protein COA71_14550 [SAR86 cluster bacterium]
MQINKHDLYDRLNVIGLSLAQIRSEAIAGRQDSGIEDEWLEDEEYYEGIDDANRGELKAWRGKPLGAQYPSSNEDTEGSTIFPNITRPYVDGAAARMGDLLFPTDGEPPFSIGPTPNPDMIDISKGNIPDKIKEGIQKENPEDEERRQRQTDNIVADAKDVVRKAKEAAKKAESKIWDWCVESRYHTHNRRVIEDACKVGTGILKGPIPVKDTKIMYKNGKVINIEQIKPASVRVFYRNFFPDPACGEDIHNGNYTWEKDEITRSYLQKLKNVPGYINEQIDRVIEEGPFVAYKEFKDDMDTPGLKQYSYTKKNMYEIWYYHGSIHKDDLLIMDMLSDRKDYSHHEDNDNDWFFVQLTMVNNRVLKASISHMQNGAFPYDVMVWQRRLGLPWGIGLARQIRTSQRMVTGATRHMMDNAGAAGGPMLFVDTNLIQAADGVNSIEPWKVYVGADDYDPSKHHVGNGIQYILAPMVQEELQKIIELGLKMAEETTGMPLILQGQVSQDTPDTLGGMILQNNNASSMLRRVARLYDDYITKPHIQRYYNHLLQFVDDDSLKGDFNIIALGASSLIEREIANQAIYTIGEFVLNPVFKKDPLKWIDEVLRISKIDPARLEYDDVEWQQIVEGMAAAQEPPPDPKLEIAKLNAEVNERMQKFEKELFIKKSDLDRSSRERIAQMKHESEDKDRQVKVLLSQATQDLEALIMQMKEKGSDSRHLEDIKQKVQDTVMKLKAQIQLSDREVSEPLVEPKGRAPDGQSYEK